MSSTFLSLHYHVVFSTKDRRPTIDTECLSRLHEYIAGTIVGLQGVPQIVGGVADHVHLLFGLKATQCLSDVMREIKKSSSVWMHDVMNRKVFSWQEGYAAFTVSPTARDSVSNYIEHQEQHHRRKTFREGLLELLIRAEVEFDNRYLD